MNARTLLAGFVLGACCSVLAQIPEEDARNTEIRHTDSRYSIPEYTAASWKRRAETLRKQVLFSAGLLPLPEKTPLNPRVGSWIHHDDHSVVAVLLETYPGFFLGGNLYRPAASREGPFPAVVSPHGHWRYGRFENSDLNSVPARAISLARQGYVVFAYDMVGWNDTMQVPHDFGGPREDLWLLGPLGLQLWNSIRVVDYLASLPQVDQGRIAVTGASGGATQAFLLAAVDHRIGFSAPVNMVSFQMQGGSPCENAPLLRIGTNNVELAAVFAPKPQLLVAATGDWTVNVPTREYPALQAIYELLDARANVDYRQFDSPHNYHRDSREAVYRFLGERVLGGTDPSEFAERSSRPDQLSSLLYLWGRPKPDGALEFEEVVRQRIAAAEADTLALAVQDRGTLVSSRQAFRERLGLSLMAEVPGPGTVQGHALEGDDLVIGRKQAGDRIPARLLHAGGDPAGATLLVGEAGIQATMGSAAGQILAGAAAPLLLIEPFQTGSASTERDIGSAGPRSERYYHVFNRSDDANRVQDIITAAAYLRERVGADAVRVVALGRAGLWALLAAAVDPAIAAVVADLDGFDTTSDSAYVDGLFIPGLRRAGDFRAVAVLLSERVDLLLHNLHPSFPRSWFEHAFGAAGRLDKLSLEAEALSRERFLQWIAG